MGKVIEHYKINISNINVNLLKELASTLPEKKVSKEQVESILECISLDGSLFSYEITGCPPYTQILDGRTNRIR